MITQKDIEYRLQHGVLPQLDFTNNKDCLMTITAPPVQHTKFATAINPVKHASAGKIATGIGQFFVGIMHLAAGSSGYGVGKMIQGMGTTVSGAVDPTKTGIDSDVTKVVIEKEKEAWARLYFIRSFTPASGNIGDTYYRDGSCDEFHCGNGHIFLPNGDYFEGLFDDGIPKKGLYIYADGERYLGELLDGLKHGEGMTLYADGTYYDGIYQNGERNIYGTMWYTDSIYSGEWYNGIRHGVGYFKQDNGYCFGGDWRNDEPVQ